MAEGCQCSPAKRMPQVQAEIKIAIATMIEATFTDNRILEVMIVNMISALITPEPTQEVKNLSFNVVGRHARR